MCRTEATSDDKAKLAAFVGVRRVVMAAMANVPAFCHATNGTLVENRCTQRSCTINVGRYRLVGQSYGTWPVREETRDDPDDRDRTVRRTERRDFQL